MEERRAASYTVAIFWFIMFIVEGILVAIVETLPIFHAMGSYHNLIAGLFVVLAIWCFGETVNEAANLFREVRAEPSAPEKAQLDYKEKLRLMRPGEREREDYRARLRGMTERTNQRWGSRW